MECKTFTCIEPFLHYATFAILIDFLSHLGAAEASCEHNTDILSPYKIDMANVLARGLGLELGNNSLWGCHYKQPHHITRNYLIHC